MVAVSRRPKKVVVPDDAIFLPPLCATQLRDVFFQTRDATRLSIARSPSRYSMDESWTCAHAQCAATTRET